MQKKKANVWEKKKKSWIKIKPGIGLGMRSEVPMTLCACWALRAGRAHNDLGLSFRLSRKDSGPSLLSGYLGVFACPQQLSLCDAVELNPGYTYPETGTLFC